MPWSTPSTVRSNLACSTLRHPCRRWRSAHKAGMAPTNAAATARLTDRLTDGPTDRQIRWPSGASLRFCHLPEAHAPAHTSTPVPTPSPVGPGAGLMVRAVIERRIRTCSLPLQPALAADRQPMATSRASWQTASSADAGKRPPSFVAFLPTLPRRSTPPAGQCCSRRPRASPSSLLPPSLRPALTLRASLTADEGAGTART
ncbi:hypothetical protein DCS_02738 [Drechmeria coniospora]|uniref:Uncharacterized protein n=1 Tax=Drechmeria coniospora TaxID=98403 RepID=A0A151GWW0_DRECN|nr:hypothetical protein DCS_02738 [Drechmeria coniospora]KYK61595.1 hypothetical protein DCS_02738 [Drechmeria coniospora]